MTAMQKRTICPKTGQACKMSQFKYHLVVQVREPWLLPEQKRKKALALADIPGMSILTLELKMKMNIILLISCWKHQVKSKPPGMFSKRIHDSYKHWMKARSGLNHVFHHTFTRQARKSKQSSDLLYGLLCKLCKIQKIQVLFKDILCTFDISLFSTPLIDRSGRSQRHG